MKKRRFPIMYFAIVFVIVLVLGFSLTLTLSGAEEKGLEPVTMMPMLPKAAADAQGILLAGPPMIGQAGPDAKGTKAPGPVSATQQATTPAASSLNLFIERIYLKEGTVHVVIARKGPDKLPADAFATTRLKLESRLLKRPLVWTLLQVDPTRKLFKKNGRRDFDTDYSPAKMGQFSATLYRGPWKTIGRAILSSGVAGTEAAKTTQAVPGPVEAVAKRPSTAVSPTKVQGTMARPGDQTSEPESTLVDMGVEIVSPSSLHRFYPGETIAIRYRITRDIAPGDITFRIRNAANGILYGTMTVPYQPEAIDKESNTLFSKVRYKELEMTLSEEAPSEEYMVEAAIAEAVGFSDPFRVESSARITLGPPNDGDVFRPNGTMTVNYRFDQRVGPGTVTFNLYAMTSSTPLDTRTVMYSPGAAHMPEPAHTFEWRLPEGINEENCFIQAEHPRAAGTTNTFSILPFTDATMASGPYDLELRDLIRHEDGRVFARIRPSGAFGADYVQIRVNDDPTYLREIVGPEETDILVGEVSEPAIVMDMATYCDGRDFQVTIDPENRHHETDEDNNSLSVHYAYWENNGMFAIMGFTSDPSGAPVPAGTTLAVPCDIGSVSRALHFKVRNCGSETILNMPTKIRIRQSGRRPRTDGALGEESFDDAVSKHFFGPYGSEDLAPGEEGIFTISSSDLSHVDSTLTIRFNHPIDRWPGLETPKTIELDFGEWDAFSATCRHGT